MIDSLACYEVLSWSWITLALTINFFVVLI